MTLPNSELQSQENLTTFEEIYQRYGRKILNLAYRMTGNEETARDLTQDIFLKVYENMDTFQGKSQIYTWIYRIAVNHILNYLKKSARRRWVDLLDKRVDEIFIQDNSELSSWSASRFPSPDHKLEKSEREGIIWSLVQSLPVKYRIPMVLYRYEGMSYQEIADAMSLSLSAVEARIYRGKKQLIKKLQPWLAHL